jgi:hypothetical protein
VVAANGGEDAEVLFDPAAQAGIGPSERERALEVLLGARIAPCSISYPPRVFSASAASPDSPIASAVS